ncbi:hypothetical protein SEA_PHRAPPUCCINO_140 [Mycobacterium phage Phrappuccino]|uniref:Uncharacterized protein n=1 Tax=Mycobacterium phage Phrappuccino TaxID=2591223 RepID=A0A514DDX5_9CAUD|nr:hypothetical protein KHQ87_gp140 [Mycobacterium phage Phrappuccino]QDH91815.1 hypothetical protein SEA_PHRAPPUCCINO_140 [Mycobacterium phage Phrappuccino]QIQ63257.1 hypothetical protein SEA_SETTECANDELA_140 [Mycobacterium phage Settecandela]
MTYRNDWMIWMILATQGIRLAHRVAYALGALVGGALNAVCPLYNPMPVEPIGDEALLLEAEEDLDHLEPTVGDEDRREAQ